MPEPLTMAATAVVATRITKGLFAGLSKRLASGIADMTGAAADQMAVAFRRGFGEYLGTSYNRCRVFKSILNPNEPLEVTKHYVHVSLTCGEKHLSDRDLVAHVERLKSIIISGLAGSGKSMFMRYLTVHHFENPTGTIPLFVELRRLNSLTDKGLLTFIRNECASSMSVISANQFNLALRAGAFLLVLDGFDELNLDIRDNIQRQILSIRKDFPAAGIVVSSRPDDRFGGWTEFHVHRVNDLDKEQTIQLIQNLPYDAGVKKRFVREVSERLYASHKSFLSSPLLATIMLLTYEGYAEIPNKMHSFYGQAFDTLFQRHDAQKEQFIRQTHTGLPLDDFKSCFAAFSALSYLQERYAFNDILLLTRLHYLL